MRKIKIDLCLNCNEQKRIKTRGLCSPCYKKYLRNKSPLIKCGCGCNELIPSITYEGNKAVFKHGHGSKGENNANYGKMGSLSGNWKGGLVFDKHHQEFLLYKPHHPYADSRGYVIQYRIIKEIYLSIKYGYPVYINPNLVVHHINHVRLDNRPENLQIMTISEHIKHHKTGIKGKKYKKRII